MDIINYKFNKDTNRIAKRVLELEVTNIIDINETRYDEGFGSMGAIISDAGKAWTGYRPVLPNTTYHRGIRNDGYSTAWDSNTRIYYYDASFGFLSVMAAGEYGNHDFTTPAGCYYIATLVKYNTSWNMVGKLNIYKKDAYKTDNIIVDIAKSLIPSRFGNILKNTDRYIFGNYKSTVSSIIFAVYEDMFVFTLLNKTTIRYSSTGLPVNYNDDMFNSLDVTSYTEIELNSTNFPNLVSGSVVAKVVIIKTRLSGYRVMIFTDKNQVYYSSVGVFGTFLESNIYSLYGADYKHPAVSDSKQGHYKLKLPSDIATRSNQFLWFNSNVHLNFESEEGFCFANYQTPGTPNKSVNNCVFFTINGADIYVKYMFGFNTRRFRKAGTSDYILNTSITGGALAYGDIVDTSAFASAYITGLTIRQRTQIIPSEADKDPVDKFEYSTVRQVTSISRGNPAVVTLDNTTDIEIGDCIVFGGDAGNSAWNALRNLTATTTDGGGACNYIVVSKSSLDITIAEALGDQKNNLPARHIHHITPTNNGVVFGTGEIYPYSWLIYMKSSWLPNTFGILDWGAPVRLNGSENGLQRSMGFHFTKDGHVIFASDAQTDMVIKSSFSIRGIKLDMNASGVWYGLASDIDDWSKFVCILPNIDPIFSFKRLGNVLFISTQAGATYISHDDGLTWNHILTDGYAKTLIVGFDRQRRRFFFDSSTTNIGGGIQMGQYIELK